MFTVYIGVGISIGSVAVIVLVAGFTTSGLCYYVHKKKRHTAEKGLSTTANSAYATELITVPSSTHGDFKTEANPAYASTITHLHSMQSSEYEEINIVQ